MEPNTGNFLTVLHKLCESILGEEDELSNLDVYGARVGM